MEISIGSNTANGSIVITTTTSSTTYLSIIRGINCNSTGGLVSVTRWVELILIMWVLSPAASTFNGIYVNNATAPSQVNNNIIGSTAQAQPRTVSGCFPLQPALLPQ